MTEENSTKDNKQKSNDGSYQPGELGLLLRHYRETAGLEVRQVAEELCLPFTVIQALEDENFQNLPEAPYVRGYLRGYAKLASMDGKELVAIYESMRPRKNENLRKNDIITPTYPVQDAKEQQSQQAKHTSKRALVVLVGVLLLSLLIFGISSNETVQTATMGIWQQFSQEVEEKHSSGKNEQELPAKETIFNNTSDAVTDDNSLLVDPENDDDKNSINRISLENTLQPKQDSNTLDNNEGGNLLENGTKEDQEDEKKPVQEIVEIGSNAPENNKEAVTVSPEEAALAMQSFTNNNKKSTDQAGEANDNATTEEQELSQKKKAEEENTDNNDESTQKEIEIKMVFHDNVWMRIRDEKGKSLFETLAHPEPNSGKDIVKTVRLRKPLEFKVGNSIGVEIYIDGKLYDHRSHIRPSGTSEFVLK